MSTTDNEQDEHYMLEAIKAAQIAEENGDVPIGAVIVCKGRIIAKGYNCLLYTSPSPRDRS